MRRTKIALSFFVFYISFLVVIIFSLVSPDGTTNKLLAARALPSYSAYPEVLGTFTNSEIVYGDGRSELVDKFLRRYDSPFAGEGNKIVTMADKYKISFGLVPAIAQCESNVGKAVPDGSFNAWGYGIYGDTVTKFKSWEDGIETVSKGLKLYYYNKGLNTPEEIMTKYTPGSNGSWAKCVNQYLAELR